MRNVAYIIKNMFQTIYYCTKTCNGDEFYCVINLLLVSYMLKCMFPF